MGEASAARTEFPPLEALEAAAAERLEPRVWAYVRGGAGEESTVRANREAFLRTVVHPRLLRGVEEIDLRTELLGRPAGAPIFVAPTAYQAMVHPDAESGVARATASSRVLGVFSTLSSHSLEQIAAASGPGERWFQLYHQPDERVERRLVERATAAGYRAIVLTADVPVLGVRDRQAEAGFAIDRSIPIGNGADVVPPLRAPDYRGDTYHLRADAGATWELLDRLRGMTPLPIVVKGVLGADDARRAVDHGAAAVIVSNHGGRQLDRAPATLDVLPRVVAAVGERAEVYLDGGVRRGIDVLIAIARGARAVGIGRPVLWALAVGGGAGVERYLTALKLEVAVALALTGRRTVREVDRALVGEP